MDGNSKYFGGYEADGPAVNAPSPIGIGGTRMGHAQVGLNAPRPQTSIAELVEIAGGALKRLHGLAENVEAIGDKLVGSVPQKDGEGSSIGSTAGTLGQLTALLSMIHATIGRIEGSVARLHSIHG